MIISAPETKQEGGAHWYTADGEPMHEVPTADGKSTRSTTLRDARKLGLMPSVTAIIKILDKWALNEWKIKQALMAADKYPRGPDEASDTYMERVRSIADQQVTDAMIKGSAIHAAIEAYYDTGLRDVHFVDYIDGVRAAIGDAYEHRRPERSFSCDLGYGGQIDLASLGFVEFIDDFKTKDFDETKTGKDLAYPEHAMQLAAYARGINRPDALLRNVFISRTVPGLVVTHEWPSETYENALQKFLALLNYWQRSRDYYPTDALQTGQDVLGDGQQATDESSTIIDGNVIYQGDTQIQSYGESPRSGRWVRLSLDDIHQDGDPLVPFRQRNGDILHATITTTEESP